MTFKKVAGFVHRWLGLIAGLVVFISLLAASIYVWEKELTSLIHHDAVYVPEVKAVKLPFHVLLASAQNAMPGKNIIRAEFNNDPRKAYAFTVYKESHKKGWTYYSSTEYNYIVYVDPYTGKVQGIVNTTTDFVTCLYPIHACLLLNYDIGHYIVGGATLIIVIMVITGIMLWWPKNRAAFKQRYWFRWKSTTKWRRKNYDFHNIGGIYSFILILIMALTGVVWTFDWWENSIYRLMGATPGKVFKEPPPAKSAADSTRHAYDVAFNDALAKVRDWENFIIDVPVAPFDSAQAISCFIKRGQRGSGWDETDEFYYDPKTGKEYWQYLHEEKNLGAKWRYSNYAIHTGSIYGMPTKILACLGALFCATLPLTGFLIWWGKRRKAR